MRPLDLVNGVLRGRVQFHDSGKLPFQVANLVLERTDRVCLLHDAVITLGNDAV